MSRESAILLAISFVVFMGSLETRASTLTPTTTWSLQAWSESTDAIDVQEVVIVDLFDQQEMIPGLHNDGHLVVCYYSAGTAEDWRADVISDQDAWNDVTIGAISGWEGEVWLDIRRLDDLKALMIPRLELAVSVGCDGVEPDNVDCGLNDDCLEGEIDAQIAYNKWTAEHAQSMGLLIGLKNSAELVGDLQAYYNFAVVEQCAEYNECDSYAAFTEAGKPIFGIEYSSLTASQCADALNEGVMMKHCDGSDGTCDGNDLVNCYGNTSLPPPPPTAGPSILTPTTGWTLQAWSESTDSFYGQKVVIIDLFDQHETIEELHSYGHLVVCYYSAGTAEDWRADVSSNQAAWDNVTVGGIGGWDGEVWLDVRELDSLKTLMSPRLELAVSLGCDAVEPANVDCSLNEDCLEGENDAQVAYNTWTAGKARELGMLVGLKNSAELVDDLHAYYDFAIVESCVRWNECDSWEAFSDAGKPIFGIEYSSLSSRQCRNALDGGIMMKHCDGSDGTCDGNDLHNCYITQDWPEL